MKTSYKSLFLIAPFVVFLTAFSTCNFARRNSSSSSTSGKNGLGGATVSVDGPRNSGPGAGGNGDAYYGAFSVGQLVSYSNYAPGSDCGKIPGSTVTFTVQSISPVTFTSTSQYTDHCSGATSPIATSTYVPPTDILPDYSYPNSTAGIYERPPFDTETTYALWLCRGMTLSAMVYTAVETDGTDFWARLYVDPSFPIDSGYEAWFAVESNTQGYVATLPHYSLSVFQSAVPLPKGMGGAERFTLLIQRNGAPLEISMFCQPSSPPGLLGPR